MDEHRRFEIPGREHLRDVRQVAVNLVAAGFVFRVVRLNFNRASVLGEQEVMRGLLMREAHGMIATLFNSAVLRAGRHCGREKDDCY